MPRPERGCSSNAAAHAIRSPPLATALGPICRGSSDGRPEVMKGFKYSPALKASGVTWTTETLDTFLTNPGAMVRGTRMTQRFNNAEERRAIIEFLGSR